MGTGGIADHSPPSGAEVENTWSDSYTPPILLHGVVFDEAQEQLYRPIKVVAVL
jgi:hypothetical protein